MKERHLLLASRSPRRRELIRLLGLPYEVMAAEVDESTADHPDPAVSVMQTARLKADTIVAQLGPTGPAGGPIVVAADTTVALDGQTLGKPVDAHDARRMLRALRDRVHEVHTGLVLIDMATGATLTDVHTARVEMRGYTDEEIRDYIATGDPMDKAGAYAIQDPQFRPVGSLDGCFMGVMGLSICHLILGLRSIGANVCADMAAVEASHKQYPCSLFRELRRSFRELFD